MCLYMFIEVPSGPRSVCSVKITPLSSMKGSPDLIPAAGEAYRHLINLSVYTAVGHLIHTKKI